MSLTGNLRNAISLSHTLAGVDLSTPSESINQFIQKAVSSGRVYHDIITLTSGQTVTLDVNDGSLVDVFGNSMALVSVQGIYLAAATANTVDVTVTDGALAFVGTLPAMSAGEGINLLTNIDTSTNTKINFVNGAAVSNLSVIIVGTEA